MKDLVILILVSLIVASVALVASSSDKRTLKMATTTSTYSSGLLDYLLPEFEKQYNVEVQVIPTGTGKALKLGENGDVDVVMVHAPEAEMKFVNAGFGVNRRPFMKNDFVIVGPPSDPAGLKKAKTMKEALEILARNDKAVFISRGDDSGTNKKELKLWKEIDARPPADRYLDIGQGMEPALLMADDKGAYTLTDRGTFLALEDKLKLAIVFEKAPELDNPYAMIAVNPARFPDANYMDAMLLIAWLTSPAGQARIGSYISHGQVLFHPTAIPSADKKAGAGK